MSVLIRPARAEELQRAEELVVRSINDLTERHGFGPMATLRPPDFQLFSLRDDPAGVWTAEADGTIAGFALSWVCGDLWFLAELFVEPRLQGSGVGRELLARTLAHADKAGATNRALITFTFNVVSQGLYIRHGMLPRVPIYFLGAPREALRERVRGETLRTSAIDGSDAALDRLAAFDVGALGVSRAKHHRYLHSDRAMTGYFLHDGDACVGYAYLAATGHIGPVAVTHARYMDAAFATALALAANGPSAQISAFLPGASPAIRMAVEHGMRIAFPMVLVSSHAFGDWTRYLPRNPGFM